MALLANLALFFVVYLPLGFAVGLAGDFWIGRYQSSETGFPLFYWIVVGWPLLVPSLLIVPVAHIALAIGRRLGPEAGAGRLRLLAIAVAPLGFLAVHLGLWGTTVLSGPLLATVLLPGAVYGLVARIPRRRRP